LHAPLVTPSELDRNDSEAGSPERGWPVSADPRKILLTVLWQRTSASGREYLSGFLGKARIVGFKGEPTPDGTPTWDIYVTPGKEQEERGSGQRESRSPTSSSRTAVQRWAPKSAAEKPAADAPFLDDDISGLGRGE
jgi:hypothetical protein